MNIEQIRKGIAKTGFQLEFDISKVLSNSGWNVINNKYYVDDQQDTVREIDIVAYKVSLVRGVYVYTALILSCKKSEKDAWVLLAKESNHSDPNMEWIPVHAWSNDRILTFMFDEQDWKETYLSILEKNDSSVVCDIPKKHIFGFQEMNMESGSPQNDKNIFNSITSVMKAQAYEMNALPLRKKEPCVFQFNLLSVAQTSLLRLDFDGGAIKESIVDDEIYVARYIVGKQQTFARVHIINSDKFGSILGHYDNLHRSNKIAFSVIHEKFCNEIRSDHKKRNLFKDDMAEYLWLQVYRRFNHLHDVRKIFKDTWVHWNSEGQVLEFQLDIKAEDIALFNADAGLRKELSRLFKKYYHYDGASTFSVSDIPF